MKRPALLLFLFSLLFVNSYAQTSAMEAWKPLLNKPGLAEYFKGTFEYLGVTIQETGETFTVHHLGTSFEMIKGIDKKQVDFDIQIHDKDISNMVENGKDAKIDEVESFDILRVIFTQLTEQELNNPMLTKRKYLRIAHVDPISHITLLDPEGKNNYQHTLFFCENQWIVVPGHVGKTTSSMRLTTAQALDFQRHIFEAKKTNTKKGFLKFRSWYIDWKKTIPA